MHTLHVHFNTTTTHVPV